MARVRRLRQCSKVPENRFMMKLKIPLVIWRPLPHALHCLSPSNTVLLFKSNSATIYQVHGKARIPDRTGGIIRIAHEAIPNYMPAMTMDLPVKNSPIPKELAAGDDVQFELSVPDADSWISHVVKIVSDSSGTSDGSIPGTSSVESATRE